MKDKDIVMEGHLKAFVESFGFHDLGESEQFERFCAYSTLNKEFNYSLSGEDLNDISVGKNKGIDSIVFCVNGELVKTKDQIDQIKEVSKQKLNIKLYFIQAKKSSSFDDKEIGNFFDTIVDFLQRSPKYKMTPESKQYHEIFLEIQNNFGIVKEYNLYAFFCCLGKWDGNNSCANTLEIKKQNIVDIKLFNNIETKPIDKSRLIELYKKTLNPLSTTFDFENRISIKNILNVQEAYIGCVRFSEFKKLIVDDDNGNLKSLFYDNIRDFLGLDNEVNDKIHQTLNDGDFTQFALLNNGVTIIAEENIGRQDNFILNSYQIVNGCQTSNVLYECLKIQGIEDTLIPIKLIITQDDTLRDKIILSTNNQSKIAKEGLLALTKFQKDLEEYYVSANDNLYYERRNNQYANKGVKQKSIVDIREQIKSFVAMFLDEPHEVSGFFSRVYKERMGDIFIDEHLLEPYYTAGLIQYKFKDFLNSREIDRKYNKARYHIFMLFRILNETEPFSKTFLSKRKKKKIYFENLLGIIREKDTCLDSFNKIFSIIDKSGIDVMNAKEIYKKSTTNTLIGCLNSTGKEYVK